MPKLLESNKTNAKINPYRAKLYKELWNAAKFCVTESSRKDEEAIRVKRNTATQYLFGRDYNECTNSELITTINELRVQSGVQPHGAHELIASSEQLKMLRFYALSCALVYCPLSTYIYTDEEGEHYSGEYLRAMLRKKMETERYIHPSLFRHLHENWINPKSHQFLLEGQFKKFVKNYRSFHYEHLKPNEAQYLISRYSQIYQKVKQQEVLNTDFIKN